MSVDAATVTLTGRAATNPTVVAGAKGDRVSFRVVATERRYDEASGEWADGDEFGVTVVCWRQLAAGVLQLVRKGDPLIVKGRISTRKFERDGVIDYFTDVKADHVGFDVAKGATRIKRLETPTDAAVAPTRPELAHEDSGISAGDPFAEADEQGAARPLVDVR